MSNKNHMHWPNEAAIELCADLKVSAAQRHSFMDDGPPAQKISGSGNAFGAVL